MTCRRQVWHCTVPVSMIRNQLMAQTRLMVAAARSSTSAFAVAACLGAGTVHICTSWLADASERVKPLTGSNHASCGSPTWMTSGAMCVMVDQWCSSRGALLRTTLASPKSDTLATNPRLSLREPLSSTLPGLRSLGKQRT